MFWNEPNLYGATFPFKDIPQTVQVPFTSQIPFPQTPFMGAIPPLQNYQRFLPQPFAFQTPHLYNLPTPSFNPIDPATFYATQWNVPYNAPYNVNMPMNYNWVRPFFC